MESDATGTSSLREEALARGSGILYARRERSSPPKVVRAATIEALREAIQARS